MTAPMRRRTIRAWLIRCALAVYVLTGLSPVQAFVLCVDGGGHIAFEAGTRAGDCFDCPGQLKERTDCCAASEAPASAPVTPPSPVTGSPCQCRDFVLLIATSEPEKRVEPFELDPGQAIAAAPCFVADAGTRAVRLPPLAARPQDALRQVRGVVLLI